MTRSDGLGILGYWQRRCGVAVKSGFLILTALFVSLPTLAEDVQYQGHTLEVDGAQEARPVVRMAGTQYSINGTALQIAQKAGGCLAGTPGATLLPDDGSGRLVAELRVEYRSFLTSYGVRSRLQVEAGDGRFSIIQSELGRGESAGGDGEETYAPIAENGGDKALDALIEAENRIVDCLFR